MKILPFDTETVWEILQSKEPQFFEIDLKASYDNMGDKLVIYMANLNLQGQFRSSHLTTEQKFDIFNQWLSLKKLYNCTIFRHTLIHILFARKGLGLYSYSLFTDTEAEQYINENSEAVTRWLNFVQSSMLYISYQLKLQGLVKDDFSDYEVIDDRNCIPLNLVHVFEEDVHCALFENVEPKDLKFYKPQFENPMFGGQYLQPFIYNPNNFICAVLADCASEDPILKAK